MHYGTIIRCLENPNEWEILRIINVKNKLYYELVIAVGRDSDGNIIKETTILASEIYTNIVEKNYSFIVDLNSDHNNIKVFDENEQRVNTFNPLIALDENVLNICRRRTDRKEVF